MSDIMTKTQRSENMKKIKSTDTQIERLLRKALWRKGYRYRKNVKDLPGKPDIVITKYKIAIFCDGEFFHGHDWEKLKDRLKTSENGEFWIDKISRNIEHDNEVYKKLVNMNYVILRFWGNDIKNHIDECVRAVDEAVIAIGMGDIF